MTSPATLQIVRSYLRELDSALAGVPDDVRHGILTGVAEELDGLDAAAAASRIVSLGDPAFIAAEAREGSAPVQQPVQTPAQQPVQQPVQQRAQPRTQTVQSPMPTASTQRWYVVVTFALIYVGGFVVPLAGWVAGILLLWGSSLWSIREKLLLTLVPTAAGLVLGGIVYVSVALSRSGFIAWHAILLGGLIVPFVATVIIGIPLSRKGWEHARS